MILILAAFLISWADPFDGQQKFRHNVLQCITMYYNVIQCITMYYIQIKPEKSYSLKLEWIVSGDDTEKTDSGMDSHHFSFLCHFICVLSLNLLRRTKILTNLTKSPFEIVYFTRQQTVVTGRIIQIGRNNGGR